MSFELQKARNDRWRSGATATMKPILLLLILIAVPLHAGEESYLKIRSLPAYPLPGQGLERSLEVSVNPSSPEDPKFNSLYNELANIASDPKSGAAPLHERSVTFEIKQDGKVVRVVYSKTNAKDNERLSQRWARVFQLAREMTNEQLNP